jgi:hypothetical protein
VMSAPYQRPIFSLSSLAKTLKCHEFVAVGSERASDVDTIHPYVRLMHFTVIAVTIIYSSQPEGLFSAYAH